MLFLHDQYTFGVSSRLSKDHRAPFEVKVKKHWSKKTDGTAVGKPLIESQIHLEEVKNHCSI
jgi:hypothetical protein